MIIAKKIFLCALMTTSFFCQGQKEEFSTREKAAAGASFVGAGIFSGYLAYTRNKVNSWWGTIFNLFCSAPLTAVGGVLLTEAITELSDQNLINQAYEVNCSAIRRYKAIMDHWSEGHTAFTDLAPLITIPIDAYLFSLKKTICSLHEQEDALKARLLNPFDNAQAQKIFEELLQSIIETHALLDQIYAVLNENTVYFVENLGEDSILEETPATVDANTEDAAVVAEDVQGDNANADENINQQVVEQQNGVSEEAQQEQSPEEMVNNTESALPATDEEIIVEIVIVPDENQEQNTEPDVIPWTELTPIPSQEEAA